MAVVLLHVHRLVDAGQLVHVEVGVDAGEQHQADSHRQPALQALAPQQGREPSCLVIR